MRVCKNCRTELPSTAPVCFHCGTPVHDSGNRPSGKLIATGALIAVLALAIGAILALGYSGILNVNHSPNSDLLQAEGTAPESDLLVGQGQQPTPIQRASAPVAPPPSNATSMPEEVRNWLEHLRVTEQRRQALTREQLSGAMITMAVLRSGAGRMQDLMDDPFGESRPNYEREASQVKSDFRQIQATWTELDRFFASVPPPQECQPIANEYHLVLRNTGQMIGELLRQLERAEQDPQAAISALMAMQGQSSERIDKPAVRTDAMIFNICERYGVRKWFEVKSDFGGGMLSGSGMF